MAADGSIVISTKINDRDAQKELNRLKKQIDSLEESIKQNDAQRSPLVQQAEELRAQIKAATTEVEKYKAQWVSGVSGADRDETIARDNLLQLQSQYDSIVQKIDKYDAAIQKADIALEQNKNRAGELTRQLSLAGYNSERYAAATEKARKSMDNFGKRLGNTFKSALIFSVLYKGLSLLREHIGKSLKASSQFSAALSSLKGNLLTAFQPIWSVILPALTTLVRILSYVAAAIARVFSFFSGKSTKETAKSAEALEQEQEALNGVGGAAKDASKQLAGFDEINKLSSEASGGGGGGASNISADFSDFDSAKIMAEIDALTIYISGALLALGAILTFTRANVPLGLGLMALGAIGLASAVVANWDSMSEPVRNALTNVLIILGTMSLAVGAILAFSGANIALGISLMITGATALGGAISLNWDAIVDAVNAPLYQIMLGLGAALMAVGAIIAFGGYLPLGIGLMIAGAAAFGTAAYLNWNAIVSALQGPWGALVGIISAGALVLGIILTFSGANIPLGIGLIIAGAAGLATTMAVNWDFILDKLKGAWANIKTWWKEKVVAKFGDIKDAVKKAFENAVDAARKVVQDFFKWVSDKISSLWDDLTSLGEASSKAYAKGPKSDTNTSGIIKAANYIQYNAIPALATGSVIPPNREFLARLGDQKSGYNIEAPESLIRRIVREESGGSGGNQTIIMEVDGQQFAKVVYKYGNRESRRIGVSLVET